MYVDISVQDTGPKSPRDLDPHSSHKFCPKPICLRTPISSAATILFLPLHQRRTNLLSPFLLNLTILHSPRVEEPLIQPKGLLNI